MVFLPRYRLTQTDSELILKKSKVRQRINFMIYLSLLTVWYYSISAQNINHYEQPVVYLFYFAPMLFVPKLFGYIKNSINEETFSFNLKTKKLTHNSRFIASLTEIQKVVIDYDKGEIQECTLELHTPRTKILIDETDASFNKEVIETAKQLSQFMGIPVEDKHPYEEKI